MHKLYWLIFAGTALLTSGLVAQNDAKQHVTCEGEYSAMFRDAKGNPKAVKIDSWHMDSMQDGSCSVDVELISPSATMKSLRTERHVLSKQFKPMSFVSVTSIGSGKEMESFKIECDFAMADISCRTTHNSSKAVATVRQTKPYIFWPSVEAPTFDFPWAFEAIASQSERIVGRKTALPLITLDEGQTKNDIVLKVQEVEQVEYLGKETIEIIGQKIPAYKFRLLDPKSGAQEFWVSESGVVLSMKLGEGRL